MRKSHVWRAPDLDSVDTDLFAERKVPQPEHRPVVRVDQRKHIGPHEGPKFQGRPLGSYRRVELRRIAALVDLDLPGDWTQQEMLVALIDRMAALQELRDDLDS